MNAVTTENVTPRGSMLYMNRLWRALLAVPVVAAVAAIGTAAPASAAISPFSASANVDLVHVNAVGQALVPGLADVAVAPSSASVNTAGLPGNASGRSTARAANLDPNLVGGAIDLSGLIVEATQTAPPDHAAPDVQSLTGPIDGSPLLEAEVATASAQARWISDNTCVADGQPIATSTSSVANASVLTGIPVPQFGTGVVSVNNATGGPATTSTKISLEPVAGQAGKAVRVNADTQLTGIVLFKGSGNEITINVAAPPKLSVLATGAAATSKVDYTAPVLQVMQGTTVVGELNATDADLDLQVPPGGAGSQLLVRLRIGNLLSSITNTSVAADAVLLNVTVLDVTGTITLAQLDVAGAKAAATVPAGGVVCSANTGDPLRDVQVDVSTPVVAPGGNFDYLISVPNRGTCTLNPVAVKATITGPAGTTISASTPPPPTKIDGLVATWDNIGPIAPNEVKLLKLAVKVPANAPIGATWKAVVDVAATCDGANITKTVTLDGIPKVQDAGSGCDLSGSDVAASHTEVQQGQTWNEYVRVINTGNKTCDAVTVTLNAPPNTSFVSCTDNCAWDPGKRTVTWTIAKLDAGQSKDLAAVFKTDADAPLGKNLPASIKVVSGKVTAEDANTGPKVANRSVLAILGHKQIGELPATGGSPLLALAGAGALGLALVSRRRQLLANR